jgi:hypothetical protein
MDYLKLSLGEVKAGLHEVARDAQSTFGGLSVKELNWKPDAASWSVAQCFEHLVTGNDLLVDAARRAVSNGPSSIWQRMPILPGVFGRLLVQTQGPKVTRKYVAPAKAQPVSSEVPGDIIQRFVDQHEATRRWLETIDQRAAERAILISPFVSFITYSVMDGVRLMVAHDRRHFEQARRVLALLQA